MILCKFFIILNFPLLVFQVIIIVRFVSGIYFKQKKAGGLKFNATVPLTKMDEKMVQMILHEYKIFNAEVRMCIHCCDTSFSEYRLTCIRFTV